LDEFITSRSEIFNDVESDLAVGIRQLGDPTQETAESIVKLTQNAGS
jgi:hypothetical protein